MFNLLQIQAGHRFATDKMKANHFLAQLDTRENKRFVLFYFRIFSLPGVV